MSNSKEQRRPLYIPHAGPALLETPLLNKGSAFSQEERTFFNLEGLLPHSIETIEEQVNRVYHRFDCCDDLERHIFLRTIQDTETLFYRIIIEHLNVMPISVRQRLAKPVKISRRFTGVHVGSLSLIRIKNASMICSKTQQSAMSKSLLSPMVSVF